MIVCNTARVAGTEENIVGFGGLMGRGGTDLGGEDDSVRGEEGGR